MRQCIAVYMSVIFQEIANVCTVSVNSAICALVTGRDAPVIRGKLRERRKCGRTFLW